MNLSQVEDCFQDYLFGLGEDMESHVVGIDEDFVKTRLGVYYNAYRYRLWDALAEDYPVLRAFIGCDEFHDICKQYLECYPSENFSVGEFGAKLPRFLIETKPHSDNPELAELAQFEWTLSYAFITADAPLLRIEDLQAVKPESWAEMQLSLHPSVEILKLKYNVPAIWYAINNEEDVPELTSVDIPMHWAVWRKEIDTLYVSLSETEHLVMQALMKGESFGNICEKLCEHIPEDQVASFAVSCLTQWIEGEMLSRR